MKESTLKKNTNNSSNIVTSLCGDNIKSLTHRWVIVDHGLMDNNDYVWHFSQHRRARPFPENLDLFWRIIATHLSKVIPNDIKVEMTKPPRDWEIKVMSIVAKDIGALWSFDEEDMSKDLVTICDHISDEIEKNNPKKLHL